MAKSISTAPLQDYAPVADRIALFYQQHPDGRITTKLISRENRETIVKAFVYRTSDEKFPAATGYAAEREGDGEVNTVACLENTETSAVGRALANLGLTASKKRRSREEMAKVDRARASASSPRLVVSGPPRPNLIISEFLGVLDTAEARGFSAIRAKIIRARTPSYPADPLGPDRLVRLEVALRFWLRRHPM